MSGERSMICIVCPVGCRLSVRPSDAGSKDPPQVSGNRCQRGIAYAEAELKHPVRSLSAIVRIRRDNPAPEGAPSMAPCKSSAPLPKEAIPGLLSTLRTVRIKPPIKAGDVFLKDPCGIGIDIVATRDIQK